MTAAQKLYLLLLVLFLPSAAYSESLPPYTNIVPGLDYLNFRDTNRPWSIHIARLDRTQAGLKILSALTGGQMLGLSPVASQAESFPRSEGQPLVAINADFFIIAKGPYQGDPLGLEIIRGELISSPGGACLWTETNGTLALGNVRSRFTVSWPHSDKIRFGLNEERKTNPVVLYTPTFGPSTRTTNGLEFILEKNGGETWLPLRADQTYSARIREIRSNQVDTILEPDIAVLSVDPKLVPKFAALQPGSVLKLSTETSTDVSRAETAIGGRPVLMTHGREGQWPVTGTNTLPRHPRTAVGWNKQYVYFVVVDGRQPALSMGMTWVELAHFFKQLGCTDAINLDGGGSTTFWLQGKIMNSPSDKHERSVANTLFIVQQPPSR